MSVSLSLLRCLHPKLIHPLLSELDHNVLDCKIDNWNNLVRESLHLMPQLPRRRVRLQIAAVQVQIIHAQFEHRIHYLHVLLCISWVICRQVAARLQFAILNQAILVLEVTQEVLGCEQSIVHRHIRSPDELGASAAKRFSFRCLRVDVGEGRSVRQSAARWHAILIYKESSTSSRVVCEEV